MVAMFVNTNRNSLPFLQAAGIAVHSKEHKKLMTTIQALHRQYLDPFKYLEEQAPDRVDELITEARISLSWLDKYEDGWPARIYLKRYVDTKRPHLMCTRYSRTNPQKARKSKASGKMPTKDTPQDFTLRKFLGSSKPSLEHHLNAFVKLGIKDWETLLPFLSWPQAIQTQFLDEGHEVLQLTSLERKGLLVGGSLLIQRVLEKSPVQIGICIHE